MKNKRIVLAAFLLMAGIQWLVPWNLMKKQTAILKSGALYKFEMASVDRRNPFRRAHMQLRILERQVKLDSINAFQPGEEVYARLAEKESGFAVPEKLYRELPVEDGDFVNVVVQMISEKDTAAVIRYPFERYQMSEKTARELREALGKSDLQDSISADYVKVRIFSGQGLVEEVVIDGKSIEEWQAER